MVRETYRDSEAVLEHIGNMGDTFGALLACCDMELHVFGEPSAELMAASAELAPTVYAHFQSI